MPTSAAGRFPTAPGRANSRAPDAHLVRDEGVAGSNPATPTNISPNKSKSSFRRAQPTAGAPGQLSRQKQPLPDPENESHGTVATATGAEVQKSVLGRTAPKYGKSHAS